MPYKRAAIRLGTLLPPLRRSLLLITVPVLTLGAIWLGNAWLIAALALVQAGLLLLEHKLGSAAPQESMRPAHAPLSSRETVEKQLSEAPLAGDGRGLRGAALVARLDDAEQLRQRHGLRYVEALHHALGLRLGAALREHDIFCALEDDGYGIALSPQRFMELSAVLAVAQRVQSHLGQSFSFEGVTHWPSVSIGFCLSERAAGLAGLSLLEAAEQAAERALRNGPVGLYSFSAVDFPSRISGDELAAMRRALENGEIHAHFQPQIQAANGHISGMEALARWNHPLRGLLGPAEFLPTIEAAGLSAKLASCILRDALRLLKQLDAQGLAVPTVSLNLSAPELRNPHLADEIAWELDHHDLKPERLVIEILETVVADSDDDVMVRNIARLAGMGCGVDLDDFGTGHASITNIRRFAVGRLKVDRSFVTHLHEDRDRQRMVSAILSMANELELGTLAEGVETPEEQTKLIELGCQHLQGFGIARPMPADALEHWLRLSAPQATAPEVAGATPHG